MAFKLTAYERLGMGVRGLEKTEYGGSGDSVKPDISKLMFFR